MIHSIWNKLICRVALFDYQELKTGYNLRKQLGELESILGKEGIKPYRTKLDDSLIDYV
jgi:hypothetical protein